MLVGSARGKYPGNHLKMTKRQQLGGPDGGERRSPPRSKGQIDQGSEASGPARRDERLVRLSGEKTDTYYDRQTEETQCVSFESPGTGTKGDIMSDSEAEESPHARSSRAPAPLRLGRRGSRAGRTRSGRRQHPPAAHRDPAAGSCTTPRSAVAKTQYGKVRGYVEDGVLTFKGVPYGADTGGENRGFRPSRPSRGTASFRP